MNKNYDCYASKDAGKLPKCGNCDVREPCIASPTLLNPEPTREENCTISFDMAESMIGKDDDEIIPKEEPNTPEVLRRNIQEELFRNLAFVYFDNPKSFDAMMRRAFKRQNQSDMARDLGISRQAVSKRLRKELGLKDGKEDVILSMLNPLERKIYGLSLNGYSEREIAKILGMTKAKIHRTLQTITRKANHLLASKANQRKTANKKNQKKYGP